MGSGGAAGSEANGMGSPAAADSNPLASLLGYGYDLSDVSAASTSVVRFLMVPCPVHACAVVSQQPTASLTAKLPRTRLRPCQRFMTLNLYRCSHDASSDEEGSQDGRHPDATSPRGAPTGKIAAGTSESDSMDDVVRCFLPSRPLPQSTCVKPPPSIACKGHLSVASSPAVLEIGVWVDDLGCALSQMATFMQDLESSGLLAEDDEDPAAAAGAEAAVAPAPDAAGLAAVTPNGASAPSGTNGSSIEPFTEPQPAEPGDEHAEAQTETTAHLSGVQEQRGEASARGDAGDSMATEDQAGEDGDGGQAEQRVLGALQGVDGWSEVMDMASRQVRPHQHP